MARAPKSQRRPFGKGEVLQPPPPAPAEPIGSCLEALRNSWRRDGSLAAIWQDWPQLAGEQLAPHCRPLQLQGGLLTVGASHPQWRQALLYSRPQLLTALRAAGHRIKDLRIQQHHRSQPPRWTVNQPSGHGTPAASMCTAWRPAPPAGALPQREKWPFGVIAAFAVDVNWPPLSPTRLNNARAWGRANRG